LLLQVYVGAINPKDPPSLLTRLSAALPILAKFAVRIMCLHLATIDSPDEVLLRLLLLLALVIAHQKARMVI